MSGIYGNNPEDRHFEGMLNDHLNEELEYEECWCDACTGRGEEEDLLCYWNTTCNNTKTLR